MTDTEISRRLALAIGYAPDHVDMVWGSMRVWHNKYWHKFDHRDERTIFRIAARYKIFPRWSKAPGCWETYNEHGAPEIVHACPATCIALAVIEASERGLLS